MDRPNNDIVISANDLTKCFGSFTAVDHISFEVKKGEIFGFLGANGAGKTTAIRMLCGLSRPSAGEAWVAGYNVATQSEKVKTRIGYMSQSFSLYEELTVSQNIELFATIYGMSKQAIRQGMGQIFQAL
ncbi:MAG: ABC transporter ATP-binding protein, partial [Muribaculaceae bacterium]|nr:ABC transporter ATP-binding protein [Muribaculaceae bacterium]